MSGHLIGCVGDLTGLGKSHKLALVAFADSADDRTHIAFPGYEGVQKWADCSRSRAAELIADLVELGYLSKHRRAHTGRRAEYVVFPDGCCNLHRTPAAEETPDVEALAAAAGVSVDQARMMLAALTSGSEISDPLSGSGSEISDPLDGDTPPPAERVRDQAAEGPRSRTRTGERVQSGSETPDPFTTSTTTPQPPASGGRRCRRHLDAPGDSCRACGTTSRQQEQSLARAAAEAHRQAQVAAAAADRQLRLSATPPPVAAAAVRTLREIHHAATAGRTPSR